MSCDDLIKNIETLSKLGVSAEHLREYTEKFSINANKIGDFVIDTVESINQNHIVSKTYETIIKNQKVIESISSLDKKRLKNTLKKYGKNNKNYFI